MSVLNAPVLPGHSEAPCTSGKHPYARDRGTKSDANASARTRGLALTYRTGSDGHRISIPPHDTGSVTRCCGRTRPSA
jgi:hypothetical protein